MTIYKLFNRLFLLMGCVLVLSACGNEMKSNSANSLSYDLSETLGEGSYSAKTADLVSTSSIDDLTDEELIENHIKMMERLLADLESGKGPSIPEEFKEDEELVKKLEAQKAKLIDDLKTRLDKLKNDADFRAEEAAKIRKVLEEAKKRIESGEGPKINIDVPPNCEVLKKILEKEDLPELIRENEEKRYKKHCE